MLAQAERDADLTPGLGCAGVRPRRLIGFLACSVVLHGLVLMAPFSPLRPVTALERPLDVKLAPLPAAPTVSKAEPARLASALRRERPAAASPRSIRAVPEANSPKLAAPSSTTNVITVPTATESMRTPVVPLTARSDSAPLVAVAPAAPVSEPAVERPPVTANAALDGASLDAYTRTLSVEVAKMRRYPAVARLRGWQGTAILTISLSANGVVLKTTVSRSSGHAVLDDQALRMLAEASPLPGVPPALHGRPLVIELPVVFALVAS